MSTIVQIFNPASVASDTFSAAQSASQGSLHFWNESPYGLQIVFQTGDDFYIPAWFHRHHSGVFQRGKITWNKQNTLASNIPPLSQVIIEAYNAEEEYPPDGPLTRQTNIGNASTVATATTSVQNDGNVIGTSIVEATVSGDVSSAVSWTNDAKIINGNAAHPGFVQFDNNLISSDGAGNLTAHGLTAGNFLVAQNTLTVFNSSSLDNNLISSDGAGHWTVRSLRLFGGGGLAKNKVVVAAVVAGKNTITHSLGSIPDYVSLTLRQGSIPSVIVSYDRATLTTSQIDIWASGAATVEIALTLL